MERYSSSVVLQEVTSLICKWNQHNTWCYPKIRGIYTERPNRLSYALPPLDVASGMLCESVCQRLWSWEDVLLSSVRFCEITFQWSGGFFFLQLIWPILRSKESASNFVSIIKKNCCRNPSNATGSLRRCHETKQNFFIVQTLQRRTNVCRNERSGRPSTSTTPENIAKVREAILADRRQTIHDVCEIAGLSYGTVQRILADNLNMWRVSARFVPRLLSDDQKALRVSACRELKQQARDDLNFISNIITGDETWVVWLWPWD